MAPRRPLLSPLPLALAVLAALASPGAWAQTGKQDDPRHDEPKDLDRVVVRASPLPTTAEDLARPVEVLTGQRLDEAKASSLGETVGKLPGVQSTYFGPGVGRPIIRGFEGARVQVLSDGLASGDVSTVSADHAVGIEPFLANQIEVLKGPATLLYGSGAIGGAVNVIDGRVPDAVTRQPLEGRAELQAGTVNHARTGMARIDATDASGHLVFHADALHRETGDYAIPGFAESAALLAAEGETPDPASRGTLPNSALRTDSAALGASWIGARGFIGGAWSLYSTRYGIPGHAHAAGEEEGGEEGEEAPVTIVMDQRRNELRGGLDRLGPFDSLRLKLADTGYTHTELEGDEVGTVFDNDALEARLELAHRRIGAWRGALGAQWATRDFSAIGEEAFVPGSRTRDAGLFWIGEADHGPAHLELGARVDRSSVDVDAAEAIGPSRDFDTASLSGALRWNFTPDLHVTLGLDRAQRAPTAEELYSDGVHVATQSVELGHPGLDVETAKRAELGLHWHSERVRIGASIYQVEFDDFIYLAETGAMQDELAVRQWSQADARFRGAEAEIDVKLADNDTGTWDLRLYGDRVRAALRDGGALPRIAPARLGGELRWSSGPWRASLGAVRTMRQDDVAGFESPTPGYTLVDAHLAWHRDTAGGNAWEVFIDGTNLLDQEARAHTSFLKDVAPLPGRGVSFGVRTFF